MMNWLDSHCHLNDHAFDLDRHEVVTRMLENQVNRIMLISSFITDFEFGYTFTYPELEIKHSLGIYPGDVDQLSEDDLNKYYQLYKTNKVEAIGEIGLDYHYGKDNKERQLYFFESQLKMASQLDKPIIVHSREANQDTLDLLKKYRVRGVLHCYSQSLEMAREYLKLGYYLSFAGPLTFKKSLEPKKVAMEVPLDHILIETDAPYLTPEPFRGRRNDPSYVKYVGEYLCSLRGISQEELKEALNKNYDALFSSYI